MAKKAFYEKESFKKLNAEWTKKLEKSGFEDIEKGEKETVVRPQVFKTLKTQYDGGSSYFELCQEILREFKFKKDIHRLVFEKHTQGMSERDISSWIDTQTMGSMSQKGINLLINRIKDEYLKGQR